MILNKCSGAPVPGLSPGQHTDSNLDRCNPDIEKTLSWFEYLIQSIWNMISDVVLHFLAAASSC
jgi:hypothetical protein